MENKRGSIRVIVSIIFIFALVILFIIFGYTPPKIRSVQEYPEFFPYEISRYGDNNLILNYTNEGYTGYLRVEISSDRLNFSFHFDIEGSPSNFYIRIREQVKRSFLGIWSNVGPQVSYECNYIQHRRNIYRRQCD